MTNYKEPFCVLPLRDIVVFPNMIVPLFVGRTKSIKALDFAEKFEKEIFLVAQKDANTDEPLADDIYKHGTLATILQLLRLPDGTVKVLVEGIERAKISHFSENKDLTLAEQKRKYADERKRFEQHQAFLNSGLYNKG